MTDPVTKAPKGSFRVRGAVLVVAMLSSLIAPAVAIASDCTGVRTGRTPINDLGPGRYRGYEGGLYPGGSNVRPAAQTSSGISFADNVVPRAPSGIVDPVNGRIVFLSIGMSNTRSEFQAFMQKSRTDPDRHPQVVAVNGGESGASADAIDDPAATNWTTVDQELARAAVTRAQVQAVWLKEAARSPTGAFPADSQELQSSLHSIVRILKQRFPNLWLVYLSSRIYAGYASTNLNPEPFAYEGGFSVKWLIQEQLDGTLPASTTSAPWLSWGPYLWADGLTPRSDALTWSCSDFESDGTHPSAQGADKVADSLLDFVHSDRTAQIWYRYGGDATVGRSPLIEAICGALRSISSLISFC